MARIRKGDVVTVLTGKDRGKSGKVLQVWPDEGRALVEQVNILKHFERRTQQNPNGGIVPREHPLALCKLALMCSKCRRPARIQVQRTEAGDAQRVCHRCKGAL